LRADIIAANTKQRLEDLYLPYKPKRLRKAQTARKARLGPLAEKPPADPVLTPEFEAAAFVNPDLGVAVVKAALDGTRHILMERFSEDAALIERLRASLQDRGLVSRLIEGKEAAGEKSRDWFEFDGRALAPDAVAGAERGLAGLGDQAAGRMRGLAACPASICLAFVRDACRLRPDERRQPYSRRQVVPSGPSSSTMPADLSSSRMASERWKSRALRAASRSSMSAWIRSGVWPASLAGPACR
jgi:hypothetical protein